MAVDRSLQSRRELKQARAELRRLVESSLRRKIADGDPELRARLAKCADREAARLRLKHGFLLRHLAPAILDGVEFLLLSDRLANRERDYASALGLLLGELRHADIGPRVAARLEARMTELVDEAVADEAK